MPNDTFPFPPFLALVPHQISVLSYYSTLVCFSLSSSWWCVCACVGMCVCLQSNCSSLETSERAASGVINCHFRLSPFLPPPLLLLLLLFLNLCPILKPHYPHPPDCCFSKIPPILISFRNSPFLHPTILSVLLSWSISCTLSPSFF